MHRICAVSMIFVFALAARLAAENLVPNSSFEVGSMERRWLGIWDQSQGWHGSSCAKVPVYTGSDKYTPAPYSSLQSALFPVAESGQPYVLSAYMKASAPLSVTLRLGGNATGTDNPPRLDKTVRVDTEWKRYWMKVDSLPKVPYDSWSVSISKSGPSKETLYIDAVQFEKGAEPSPYAPAEAVAFGLATDKPRNVFDPGKVTLKLLAYNRETSETTKELELLVKDYFNRTVLTKSVSVACPGAKPASQEIEFEPGIIGSLRCELYEKGGPVQDEIIVSVLPPVAVEDRNIGYAYGGVPDDPNFMVYPRSVGLRYGGRWVHEAAWPGIQPDGPEQWNWEKMDKAVANAEKCQIKFIAMFLGGTPDWAKNKTDKKRPHPYGFDLDDWDRYVAAITKRYAGRVDSWGIWNEPYFQSVDAYLELMKSTYPAIKGANPQAEVCGIDSPATTVGWTEQYLKAGGIQYVDVFTTHSYGGEGGYLPETIQRVFKWASYDGKVRPVYNTETQTQPWWTFSWYTSLLPVMSATSIPEYSTGLSAEEGAQRWTKLYLSERAMGVKIVLPHLMFRDRYGATLLRCTGGNEADLSLSPKLTSWAAAGRMIGTAQEHGQAAASPLLRVMLFSKGADAIAAVWTRQYESPPLDAGVPNEKTYRSFEAAKTHRGVVRIVNFVKGGLLKLPASAKVEACDFMGNPIETAKEGVVPVSMDPIYIIARNTTHNALAGMIKAGELSGFGRFEARASIATGPDGDAGVALAVQSLWGAPQEIKVEAAGQTELLSQNKLTAQVGPQAEIEAVLPFKDPKTLPEIVGPFSLKVAAADQNAAVEVPAFFIAKSYQAKKPVVLDGKLDEWGPEVSLRLDTAEKIPGEKARAAWKGPQDASSVMRSAYDKDYLYLAFEVTDNSISRKGSVDTMYQGDCLEMFFDANVLGDVQRGDLDTDDFRVAVGPIAGKPFAGMENSLPGSGVKSVAVKTDKGNTVEVALPWALFIQHGAGPYPGTVIGFTVNQYDKDENEERGHATLSWTEKPLWWTNTGTWGRLILLP